jgi:inner membrane protein involved in colicin E2 resistance
VVTQTIDIKEGVENTLVINYKTRGMNSWKYDFVSGVVFGNSGNSQKIKRARNFDFKMYTSFDDIDFPGGTMSPSKKSRTDKGWLLEWDYANLISGFMIGMKMPDKVNPGTLAGQVCYFAPVSLFFFFMIIFLICMIRGIEIHPINYVFLAAAFFSFHLLMAYLADQIDIAPAFAVSAVVSVFLVVSYLRLVAGLRFAVVEAGGAQLIYLVLFSYAFFFKGFTGLSITVISIVTLFLLMQMTGRIKWSERLKAAEPKQSPADIYANSAPMPNYRQPTPPPTAQQPQVPPDDENKA